MKEIKSQTHEFCTIPVQVLELVKQGVLEDTSYCNDSCPSFGFGDYIDDEGYYSYTLWVDSVNPEFRDCPEICRFAIVHITETTRDGILHSDDIDEVLAKIESLHYKLKFTKNMQSKIDTLFSIIDNDNVEPEEKSFQFLELIQDCYDDTKQEAKK